MLLVALVFIDVLKRTGNWRLHWRPGRSW